MAASVLDRLQQTLGFHPDELAGAAVEGLIPLTDALVNRLITRQLAQSSAPIEAARIETAAGGTFVVHVEPRGLAFLSRMKIVATLDHQPELPHAPVVGLRWSVPGFGPLTLLAGPALALFKALPEGIAVDGDRITLDLRVLLRARGLEDLLRYVSRLQISTTDGATLVQFALRA